MKKVVIFIILLISTLISVGLKAYAETDDLTDILLLNSYHDGYQWSNDTKQGVKDVLDAYTTDYHMRIEHMDTKNISTDAYMAELVDLYKIKYDRDEFDIILCADDNALKFLLRYRDELFGDTPVFFCGVNTLATHDFTNAKRFYGVVEKHSIAQTTEIALQLNPEIKHVYLVVDDSITGRATKKDAILDMAYLEDRIDFRIFNDLSFDEIIDEVNVLNPEDTIVIQSFYVVDKDGKSYPLEYTAKRLIEQSPVPVFGIFSFGFGEGSVGGKFVEGYTQGQRAAKLVIDYLDNGTVRGKRFIVDESFNRYYFDYNMMKEYGYDMALLPKYSILINVPVSFYQRHKTVINISAIVLFFLLIYVYVLRRQIHTQTNRIVSTQTQLLESEKMASLGRLVAGVAHEVNTPIGIGVSLASFIRKETSIIVDKLHQNTLSGPDLKTYLQKVSDSSDSMGSTMERAAELVQNFKQVAVDQTVDEKRLINIGHYINDIVSSLRSELRHKNVTIDISSEESMLLMCHTGAIYQIVLNLIMNSLKHGFEDKGNGNIAITIDRDDQMVTLIYRDDGVGIPPNELKKIFDPFFTTKRHGGGSGLGLNIVYDLVTRRLKGEITCESILKEYTEFTIVFPVE